jgi:P4 family phage/plasmid primase-like protien
VAAVALIPPKRTKAQVLASRDRPPIPPPNTEGIPQELKDRRAWVCWHYEWRVNKRGEGKWNKVPLNARTGANASSTDPGTWSTFQEALDFCQRRPAGTAGLGFVFAKDDPYSGVDLDDAVDPDTGELKPWAREIVECFDTYAECSPSGTGVKLFIKGKPPCVVKTKQVEVYGEGRYFAVTGLRVPSAPAEVNERADQLKVLCEKWKGQEPPKASAPRRRRVSGAGETAGPTQVWSNGLLDEEVLEKLAESQTAKLRQLLAGNTEDYESYSEADLAFTSYIAFYAGPDPVQVERIFTASPLGKREKWDRADYRTRTITRSLKTKADYWAPSGQDVTDPARLARAYLAWLGPVDDGPALRRWNDSWWRWDGRCYVDWPDGEVRANLTAFLGWEFRRAHTAAVYWAKYYYKKESAKAKAAGQEAPRATKLPKRRHVKKDLIGNVLQNLEALGRGPDRVIVPAEVQLGSWVGDDGRWGRRGLVAVANGLLDVDAFLRGDQRVLLPHSRRWFGSACLPFDFDPEAQCPTWLNFLGRVLEGDRERIALLQELFGLFLVFDTTFEVVLALVGEGANGKSVVLVVLEALLGSDNVSNVALESFNPNDRFALVQTLGKLVNIIAEVGEIDRVAEGRLKQFVSGERMLFDRKNKPPIQAAPTARVVLATNNLPRFSDKSDGLWRRLKVLPFRVSIPEEEQDKRMKKPGWWLATGDMPGILAWALEGLRRLRRQGRFTEPELCKGALAGHRLDSNPARRFLEEHCRKREGGHVSTACLYGTYKGWCELWNYRPLSENVFGQEVGRVFPHLKELQRTKKRDRITDRFTREDGTRYWGYPDLDLSLVGHSLDGAAGDGGQPSRAKEEVSQ